MRDSWNQIITIIGYSLLLDLHPSIRRRCGSGFFFPGQRSWHQQPWRGTFLLLSTFFLSSLVSVAFAKENWLTMERREKKGDNDGDHLFYFVVILFLPIKICWKFSLGVERRKRLTRQKKWKKIPLNKNVPGIELRTFLNDVIALMLEQTPSPDSFVSLFYVSFVDVPCH